MSRVFFMVILLSFLLSCHSGLKKIDKISERQELAKLINQSIYEIDKMPGFNPYDGRDFWVWQRRDSLFIMENGLSIFLIKNIKDCYNYGDKSIWIIDEFKTKFQLFDTKKSNCEYVMGTTGYTGIEKIFINGMIYRIFKRNGGYEYKLLKSGSLNEFINVNSPFSLERVIIPEPIEKIPQAN